MKQILSSRFLSLVAAALAVFTAQARAQISPVRLSVSKNEKKDQKTTYQDSSGYYRQQQVNKTVSYTIEVRNASAAAIHGLAVKWTVLYDSSRVESHGAGGGTTWSDGGLKVVEGQRTADLGIGQRLAFDTDPVDLTAVSSGYTTTTQRHQYGGDIRGYCVEVLGADGKLLTSEIQPADTKQQIEQVKAKARNQNAK